MKTLLILSAILCAALSIEAATVVPAEAAAEEQAAANPEVEAGGAVAFGRAAVLPQARLSFCLDGWHSFRGNCYLLVNTPETWRNAESYCASFEGSLVSVHSIWEYRFLQRLAKTGGHSLAWMGGYFFQGDWRWEDGTLFDYSNWEPLSSTSSYQCLQLNSDESKGWSNHGCSMRFPFICELRSNC
ncbi:ladderlectin-like [Myripristis murdjan]|uniref:ladderlectin-like n=1 Tax=Myripristis murdjan TaxID=586833 RepID=UPI0011763043|nr:ladderlectin-like [Myripristis murdjan]